MIGDVFMEEITLEKIDTIRKRTGLSYGDAKVALENNEGNVVDTLIYLENNKKSFSDNFSSVGNDILNTVKEIIKKGNVNRIKIKKDNQVLVDIPVSAGIAVGALTLFQPIILAIGTVTAIATKISIEIEHSDGSIEVINDIIKNTFDSTIDRAKDLAHDMNPKKDPFEANKEEIYVEPKYDPTTEADEEAKEANNNKDINE
jgi:hypothetical protein